MDIDNVFREIGELGRQQVIYCFSLCLLNAYASMHMLQYAFVSFAVDFECVKGEKNMSNVCSQDSRSNCDRLVFKTDKSSSIVSEWGLVCDENWKSKATMSGFMFGVMIGALVLGKLADSIGRKANMTLTTIGIIIFNTVSAFATSYTLYVVAKFCVGFFCAGNILSMFVLGNELVGSSKRGIFGVTVQSFFAVGIVIVSLIAYYMQQWRQFTLAVSLIGLPFLSYHFFMPESPRWLIAKNRTSEAVAVLEMIARGNGRTFNTKHLYKKNSECQKESDDEGLLDLFKHYSLAILTLVQIYSWFVNSGAYYGLTIAAGSAGGDLYTSTALSGAVEIPAYVLTNFLLGYLGRKRTLAGFMVMGGVACLAIQMVPDTFLTTTFALMGKLCLAASFAVVYIHSGEIFPTTIRNSAMGLVSVAARCGGIVAPFIVLLGDQYPNLQFTVFGVLSLTAGIGNLYLPETLGKPLPDDLNDTLSLAGGSRSSASLYSKLKTRPNRFAKMSENTDSTAVLLDDDE